IWNALERTLPYIKPDTLVVVTSQVPVGTSEKIKDFIKSARPDIQCGYVYTPENLRLSEAVKCFLDPGRVVVGVERDEDFEKIREIFSPLRAELLRMSVVSAEVGKHALNSFLATSISFANDIADICEVVNADILDVIKVLRTDPRIGPKAFLTAGLGFSGGTLGRDLRVLMPIIKANHIEPSVIEAVFEKNSLRKHLVKNKLSDLFGSLRGKTVSFFGLTYKAGTKTLRRSMAIEIAKECVAAGAIVRLHDPEADIREVKELIDTFFSKDPYETAEGAEAIVVMTPWPVFKELDFSKLAGLTKTSKILFDTTNFL
ncbi:UDP-glucose/GDP-mannose dehydrogenase family protein, partial [Candidatus Peregrinibacteria bacterium]|nr:UDP-glucose/GDP-mannose dehydrogenase family protein [Candidatus Peregrinibacteria bacterium]